MNNDLMNAIVAIVEDRPADARSILRSNPGAIQARLYHALDTRQNKFAAKELRAILLTTLRLEHKPFVETVSVDKIEQDFAELGFYGGIQAVEHAIEERLKDLEEET